MRKSLEVDLSGIAMEVNGVLHQKGKAYPATFFKNSKSVTVTSEVFFYHWSFYLVFTQKNTLNDILMKHQNPNPLKKVTFKDSDIENPKILEYAISMDKHS